MIIPYNPSSSYVAISYPTTTYDDLEFFLSEENVALERVDPGEFLNSTPDLSKLYINLVTRDFTERQKITEFIDNNNLTRFSFFHKTTAELSSAKLGSGIMFYPCVSTLTKSSIGNDVIIGGYSGIGHKTSIGTGTIIDSFSVVAGSSVIGKYCHLFIRATVYDKINICDHVAVGAGSFIRKDITEPGTYATVINQKMVKFEDSSSIDNG